MICEKHQRWEKDLDPLQQEIIEFRRHDLASLLNCFQLRASLESGNPLDLTVLQQIIDDVRAILKANNTSSEGFRLWKFTNLLKIEFAIRGAIDLKGLKNAPYDAVQQIGALCTMVVGSNSCWDACMDDSLIQPWLG